MKNPDKISEYREKRTVGYLENNSTDIDEKAYRKLDDFKVVKYLEIGIHSNNLMNYETDVVENIEKRSYFKRKC